MAGEPILEHYTNLLSHIERTHEVSDTTLQLLNSVISTDVMRKAIGLLEESSVVEFRSASGARVWSVRRGGSGFRLVTSPDASTATV
jgi:hypothetical protein